MLNIAIFGCCCSGDILRLSPEGFNLTHYYASTSIVSQMAKSLPVDETGLVFRNRFQRRCVLQDFRKTFLADLARQPVDYLLVDLMQEGSRHARVGGSLVKWTSALRESNLEQRTGYRFTEINGFSPELRDRWREACPVFLAQLKDILPPERIILHRAIWKEKYRDGSRVIPFSPEQIAEGRRRNTWYNRDYEFFAASYPGIYILDINDTGLIAGKEHSWGLTPHHYEDGYYRRAADEIRKIAGREPIHRERGE